MIWRCSAFIVRHSSFPPRWVIYEKIKTTAKHTIIFGVGGVVNRALGVLLIPLYLQNIREREYGALQLMIIAQALLNVVLPLGMGNALMRSYYDFPEEERPRVTTTALVFLVSFGLACLIPLYALTPLWNRLLLGDAKFEPHFRLIFIISFFQVVKLVPDAVLRAKMQSVRYVAVVSTAFFIQLSVIVYCVALKDMGIFGILIGTLAGAVVETTGLFILTLPDLTPGFDRAELKKMLAFGSPLIVGRLSATCLQYIDRLFILHYASALKEGQRQVGLYGMANNVSGAVTFLVTTPFGAVWPAMQVSVMKDHDAQEYYARVMTYVMFVAVFLGLGVSCVTGDLFRFFGGFTDAAPVVPVLAVAAVLDAASQILSVGVSLKRKTYLNPVIYATAAGANIGLNFLLIPRFGIMGAAYATAIGFFVLCALRWYVSDRYVHVPYEWRRLLHLLAVAGGLFFTARLISTGRTIFDLLLHGFVASCYPFILAGTGFFDARERRKLAEYRDRFQTWRRGLKSAESVETHPEGSRSGD